MMLRGSSRESGHAAAAASIVGRVAWAVAGPSPPTLSLPRQPNPLVGREREVESMCGRLRQPNISLLTLTGAGGVGKTRLAIAIAEALHDSFEHGVWFVDLSPLRDANHVVPTISRALGVGETGGSPMLELLANRLQGRQLLLVLDNFEQVLAAAGEIAHILVSCPGLKALVTSREPLRLRWEHVHVVHPLALAPAVALFTERAQAADSSFRLSELNTAAVSELCQRSDRLPLALEIAAPYVRSLSPGDILTRLGRISTRASSSRDAPARHRSLHAAVGWSYQLLDVQEQLVFRRLSVFVGGFTLDAAQAVCGPSVADLPQCLVSLIDKSLVTRVGLSEDRTRFRLLETVREYARAQLDESGEESAARDAHAAFFLDFAERAESELSGPRQATWFDQLQFQHDNLRTALRWNIQSGSAELAMRLAGALWRFWWTHGYLLEGQRWLEEVLACAGESSPAARAKALNGAGNLAAQAHAYTRSTTLHEECLALRRAMGDRQGVAISLQNLAVTALYQGDYDSAVSLSRRALLEAEAVGDRLGVALVLMNLGDCAQYQGQLTDAQTFYKQSLAIIEDLRDDARAARLLSGLAWVAYQTGDYRRALSLGRSGLNRNRTVGDQPVFVACLEPLGVTLVAIGQHVEGLQLLGAASLQRELNGMQRLPADAVACERAIVMASAALGRRRASAELERGRNMSLQEIVADALAESDNASTLPAAANPLTQREEQVAALIARGCSNRQLAEELVIATSTAERHVANILSKLGLGSRAQIAVWAVEHGLCETTPR
jgi:non-specific serine/threonine protein kinase